MEIRNALKKIDNYLSAVQVLNKTILEEGTMAPEELRLMKKYLRGCIERIEEIESKLHIADTEVTETALENPVVVTVEEVVAEPLSQLVDAPAEAEAEPVEEPVWDLTLAAEQIIIDPEQTRTVSEVVAEPEPEMTVTEPEAEWEAPSVVAEVIVSETEPEPVQLTLIQEETVSVPVVETPTRSWAELWAEEQEPAVNNLVAAQDAEEMIPLSETVSVVSVTTVTETIVEAVEPEPVAAPLVAAEEAVEEPVVETIVAYKTETTLNDTLQSRHESGLFERFTASRPEPVAPVMPVATAAIVQAEVADTDVLVAEPELPELSLTHILNKVRNTGEERTRSAKTLSESIALNDKFIFVRELFANQFNEYENALRTLDQFNCLDEAQQFCRKHLEERFHWNDRPANAERFYSLLEKRFSA